MRGSLRCSECAVNFPAATQEAVAQAAVQAVVANPAAAEQAAAEEAAAEEAAAEEVAAEVDAEPRDGAPLADVEPYDEPVAEPASTNKALLLASKAEQEVFGQLNVEETSRGAPETDMVQDALDEPGATQPASEVDTTTGTIGPIEKTEGSLENHAADTATPEAIREEALQADSTNMSDISGPGEEVTWSQKSSLETRVI